MITIISGICGIRNLHPDTNLYAGGISLMCGGQYLNPHLYNSHDKDRNLWRVLNLLYYVSPDWKVENDGNLELWPSDPKGEPITIHSRFNRLAVMAFRKSDQSRCKQMLYIELLFLTITTQI